MSHKIAAKRVAPQAKKLAEGAPEAKGKSSRAAVGDELKRALESGAVASKSLSEMLALDMRPLLASLIPKAAVERAELDTLGIAERMQRAGALLASELSTAALAKLIQHPSDTVRGWLAFAWANQVTQEHHGKQANPLPRQLERFKPLAADTHFGVREWAWLALRPQLAANIDAALAALQAWTQDSDENLRRFASESTRPRGVWCRHIPELRAEPARALSLLEALKADPAHYVQLSVGNWLNDASKDQPEWVRTLCARWQSESACAATLHITRRARAFALRFGRSFG
jgi:3-methyladenine DNA glycosylase AlkC